MGRVIIFVVLALGCYYIYDHQDEFLTSAKEMFMKEKTIMKVNDASAQKEKAIQDAMNQALEY